MNDIEKAIEALQSYEPCSQKGLYEAHKIAISALKKLLNGGWIPVSDGKYIIEVKEGEVVSCCMVVEELVYAKNGMITLFLKNGH